MPILRSLVREVRETPLTGINDPTMPLYQSIAGWLDGLGGASRVANLPAVNPETAIRITAVYRAVKIIASTIGMLPFTIYSKADTGEKSPISPTHPGSWLVDTPNPEVTRSVFWETSIGHCLLSGNCYWFVQKDGLERARELWPINPKRVQVLRDPATRRKFYTLDNDQSVPYADYLADGSGEIVHVMDWSQDGLKGVSVLRQARLALQINMAAEEFAARLFADGSLPGGIITTNADLNEDQARKLKDRWERYHKGLSNAHRVAVLDNGASWQQTMISPEEAQFLQTRGFQVQEIARLFGIAPHLLADVTQSTSWGKGIEEQMRNTVTFTLQPFVRRFEDAASFKVLSRWPNLYGRFDLNELLRGDTFRRYQGYAFGRQWGFLSINDIRRMEDLPNVPGGDDYMVPMNMTNATPNGGDPAALAAEVGLEGE